MEPIALNGIDATHVSPEALRRAEPPSWLPSRLESLERALRRSGTGFMFAVFGIGAVLLACVAFPIIASRRRGEARDLVAQNMVHRLLQGFRAPRFRAATVRSARLGSRTAASLPRARRGQSSDVARRGVPDGSHAPGRLHREGRGPAQSILAPRGERRRLHRESRRPRRGGSVRRAHSRGSLGDHLSGRNPFAASRSATLQAGSGASGAGEPGHS